MIAARKINAACVPSLSSASTTKTSSPVHDAPEEVSTTSAPMT